MQDKIEDQENNSHIEILEERLKLVESELRHAIERAEKAEKALVPPAPPLPPPPPLPPVNLAPPPPTVPLRIKKLAKNGVPEIADALGMNETITTDQKKATPQFGVHEDIINQIKGGTFTLKKSSKGDNKKKDRETPKAVSEMLNVLGSLRKVTRSKMTVSSNFGDVQL